MPTVKDLIAELKQLGVRGYSKKLKGELMYMLVSAKKAKGEVKKPEPIKIAIKDIRAKRAKEREQEEEKKLEDAENAMRADLNMGLKQIIPKKTAKVKRIEDNKSIITTLTALIADALEASKEGGTFKRRENWKGKAGYMKKIDALWNSYTGGADTFYGVIPFNFGWKPKQ